VRDLAPAGGVFEAIDGIASQMEKFIFGREFAARELPHLRRGADHYLGRLYDALVKPLEESLGDRDLVVIPHGRLHYAPFHALYDGERYVIERRAVSYAPSATVYAMCATAPRGAGSGALLCGVSDGHAPEIDRELETLQGLFPGARVLSGAAATRAAFAREAEGCRVVHVASHASFRRDNPMLSGLHLADGDFSFYDVFGLRLSADVVVLSGCNTGTVAVGGGDELHGLVRGFLYAGAPSLVISMWAADDAATAELMREFHERLRGGYTPRDALRAAQCSALARHEHPYYWAPFTLLGRAV
jgi:CHAT domain-containing protein